MITAVDVIAGIGKCAAMDVIPVEGATGYIDTNYEGKAQAAIKAIEDHDFVYVHLEATKQMAAAAATMIKDHTPWDEGNMTSRETPSQYLSWPAAHRDVRERRRGSTKTCRPYTRKETVDADCPGGSPDTGFLNEKS